MPAFDYKKEYKELYRPKNTPSIIDIPTMWKCPKWKWCYETGNHH